MLKMFVALFAVFGISFLVSGQGYEGTIEYDKKKQDAFMIDYPYTTEAAQNAIIAKMEEMGYRAKEEKGLFNKDKGFLIFKSAFITTVSTTNMDYLFKIEQKGRKAKDECIIYMIMMKDGANAKTSMTGEDVAKAKAFLNGLRPEVEAAHLEIQIKQQEEILSKAEKKLRVLKDDETELEKELSDNKKSQSDTQKEIENQKKLLEALKAKRLHNQ